MFATYIQIYTQIMQFCLNLGLCELNIFAKIFTFKQGCKKWGHSYTNQEKRVKGAFRIPGSPEKGGYSGRTSVPFYI